MTLMCIDRSQSPTHKGNFLQGRKSPVNNNHHHNNNNNNQQNANHHNHNHHHHHHQRRNSCSPPLSSKGDVLSKSQNNPENNSGSRKLERSASEPDRRSGGAVQTNSSRYKTELCRPFEENGTCKYGDKCQFAHGMKELRSMARHPKYKTELCRTFHSTGLCPYGPRCHFIHNNEDKTQSLLTNLSGNNPLVGSKSPPMSRQKALTSLGSAGDISPLSSHGSSPTGLKSFEDLYKQAPLSPTLLAQTLVNMNHPNFEFAPVDCFPQDAFHNFVAEGNLTNGDLDNYGFIGGFISDFCHQGGAPVADDGIFLRLPIFNRLQSKQ